MKTQLFQKLAKRTPYNVDKHTTMYYNTLMKPLNSQTGFILPLTLLVVVLITLFAGMSVEYTMVQGRATQRAIANQQAIAIANGILDSEFVQWRAKCMQNQNIPLNVFYFSTTPPSFPDITGTGNKDASFITSTSFSIRAIDGVDPLKTPLAGSAIPNPAQSQNNYMTTYNYLAEADVTYTTLLGTNTMKICKIFQKSLVSAWQYAIFYNDDMEIDPENQTVNSMNITGDVHTNGNFYSGGNSNGTNSLVINGRSSASGSWNPNGSWSPTDTLPYHTGTPHPPTFAKYPIVFGGWKFPLDYNTLSSNMNATFSTNPNTSHGYHEIIERPRSGYTDTMIPTNYGNFTCPSQRMYNQAGVKIFITTGATSATTTINIYNQSGTLVTGSSVGTTDKTIYNTFKAALTTNISVYDAREGSNMQISELDISKIVAALDTGGALNNIGCNIVYITDTTANNGISASGAQNSSGLANRGIRLVNGYKMPAGGLTIVSDNPVYIKGDYNTSNTSALRPPSSAVGNLYSGSTPLPYASGYTVQPCAIMADAVTILSSSWNDANSALTVSSRVAANTTVNTAVMAGTVMSGPGYSYSGGANNLIRYLENWQGKYFTFYGSLVELYQSSQATAIWRVGGLSSPAYYYPPTREYFLDNRFLQTAPPAPFALVNYVKSQWFKK